MSGVAYALETLKLCNDLTEWTKVNAVTSQRDVEESTDFALIGDTSFRFYDTTGLTNIMVETELAHSFKQDDRLGLLVYNARTNTGDATNGAMMQGSDNAASFNSGNRWQALVGTSALSGGGVGWSIWPISFGDTTSLSGSPTIAIDYTAIRVGLTATGAYNRETYINAILRYRSRPHVIITFDDGQDSSYTSGFSYANAAGVPLTHYIPAANIGASGFLTQAQVREMLAAGDVIGAHSQTVNAWEVSPAQIAADVDAVSQVTGVECSHGSWPNGRYGQGTQDFSGPLNAAIAAGLDTVRATHNGLLFPFGYSPHYLQGGLSLGNGTSLAAAKARIDAAIKHGMTAVFYGHKLDATAADSITWAISDWEDLIDYIVLKRKQGLLETATVSQWMDGDSRPTTTGR